MNELLPALLRVNLAAAAAIALVMALRLPFRQIFGARVAYGLWMLVPLAAGAMLAPGRVVTLVEPAAAMAHIAAAGHGSAPAAAAYLRRGLDIPGLLTTLWLVGAALSLAAVARRQAQFARALAQGRAGPAVIGVLRPRIVTPDDFTRRYSRCEQQVILAHEQAHIARQDCRINALAALARSLCWFNPLAYVLAHYLRIDQELACDAQVMAAHPARRRSYAEAMLKTQLTVRPLPLGCYWPAASVHPLARRIALLSRRAPGRAARALGGGLVALVALGGAWTAWAARPAQVMLIAPSLHPAPAAARPPVPVVLAQGAPRRASAHRRVTPAGRPESAPTPPVALAAEQPLPPEGCGADAPDAVAEKRELPPGLFGPLRKIHAAAEWSSVEPGSAVRVFATMTDPDGIPLTTDLTAFGSQSWYRVGCVRRDGSRYKLFTAVTQHGQRLVVTAALDRSFRPLATGAVELASGETGTVRLPNGLLVSVTPVLRPETPEETARARLTSSGRPFVNLVRAGDL